MEYRNNEFIKYYQKYLIKFDRDKGSQTKHGDILLVRTNFTMRNQMQLITENYGVYYTNMWEVVFGELRPYLKNFNKLYVKVNCELTAEELIDDLFSTNINKA